MMNEFKVYLEQKNMVKKNIVRMVNLVEVWLKWLPVPVQDSAYKHLLDYIGHLQDQDKSISQMNRILQAISHYYQFKGLPNVALTTRVKGRIDKAFLKPFTSKQLDEIYHCFEAQKSKNYFSQSDKILLGLIIYQGLELGDFMALELKDVDLEKGIIYVPARGQRRSRKIALMSHQILQLHQYVNEVRDKESEKLFSPQCNNYHQFHWQSKRLSKHLKKEVKTKLDLTIEKLNHLRQSRIAIWVRELGIRKAQYLAGFRRVLSAERYRKADLEDLKEQIKKYHPLG